ncbi:MAG TPA: pectate lyase [Phycisphaerae bacterium]|nr:pectate lyase [Phycisphaerae bacterium]HRY71543.1 pectate lyase [Phycisphaerae bacterium]HSA30137.1 pectate lyase [Phycisphaerae bacterium]
MHRSLVVVLGLQWAVCPAPAEADKPPLRDQAVQALRQATEFFRTQVATEGGYLWRYSADLTRREGEGKASETTIWVQPPGTPSVGMAYLDAHEATRDRYYLEAAKEVAYALVRGQLRSGGWDYRIEFDPKHRRHYAYRVDGGQAGPRNVTTLDDDTSQAALRFLMRVDRAYDFQDERIHEAAGYALASLLKAQYPNGSWPQRFDSFPEPSKFPSKRASFPATWPREFPETKYAAYYTLNDCAVPDMIATMLEAWRIYGEGRYRSSAERAGDFLLLAQMPEPQPAWAQQYDTDMYPAWARRFEPPAITGGESQVVMRTLLVLHRATGDRRYLEPLPRAIAYFRRSRLSSGQLARFYELQTNKPLYFTRDYKLTYSDADMPTHYAFKVVDQIREIERDYEQLREMDLAGPVAAPEKQRPKMAAELERRVHSVIAAMDDRGRWIERGRLRYQGDDDRTERIIDCGTFADHMKILSDFPGPAHIKLLSR